MVWQGSNVWLSWPNILWFASSVLNAARVYRTSNMTDSGCDNDPRETWLWKGRMTTLLLKVRQRHTYFSKTNIAMAFAMHLLSPKIMTIEVSNCLIWSKRKQNWLASVAKVLRPHKVHRNLKQMDPIAEMLLKVQIHLYGWWYCAKQAETQPVLDWNYSQLLWPPEKFHKCDHRTVLMSVKDTFADWKHAGCSWKKALLEKVLTKLCAAILMVDLCCQWWQARALEVFGTDQCSKIEHRHTHNVSILKVPWQAIPGLERPTDEKFHI